MMKKVSTASVSNAPMQELISEKFLTIAEMAEAYKVSHRALRFYEDRGLLRPHREANIRLYGPAEQDKLAKILKGKSLGFTLMEITAMLENSSMEQRLVVNKDKVNDQIKYLLAQRDQIDIAINELSLRLSETKER